MNLLNLSMDLTAKMDPKTFSVRLIDANGIEIDKNDLSAGEKQIYAISILEALGKTSGRKLPIIIDTPLGRLDSKHRTKLVSNYFPTASHQVIRVFLALFLMPISWTTILNQALHLPQKATSGKPSIRKLPNVT